MEGRSERRPGSVLIAQDGESDGGERVIEDIYLHEIRSLKDVPRWPRGSRAACTASLMHVYHRVHGRQSTGASSQAEPRGKMEA
jgi:hypothetical protein